MIMNQSCGSHDHAKLAQEVRDKLLKKASMTKKSVFNNKTAILPCNSQTKNLQAPVPTLEDLKTWDSQELQTYSQTLDVESLSDIPINPSATTSSQFIKISTTPTKSVAEERAEFVQFVYDVMQKKIANTTSLPLSDLHKINPLDNQMGYKWVFSKVYSAFPAKELGEMSLNDLKLCNAALNQRHLTLTKCVNSGKESDVGDGDSSPNSPRNSQVKKRKSPNLQALTIQETEKKLWFAISKARSKAFTNSKLSDLLVNGPIPHPEDLSRTYRWKSTSRNPCFPVGKRSLWEWAKEDLIAYADEVSKGQLTFELDVPRKILGTTDRPILTTPPSKIFKAADANMSAREHNEAVGDPFPGRASSTAIRRDTTTSLDTMEHGSEESLIKKLEDFVAQEEVVYKKLEDQARTLTEGFRKASVARNPQLSKLLSQFVALSHHVKAQESEISRLQRRLDEETSKLGVAEKELLRSKTDMDSLSKRMDEELKKAREEGLLHGIEHENRRQSSIQNAASLVQFQELQNERNKAFGEGQEKARQTMGYECQLLNEALGNAQAEIERLKRGLAEGPDEMVSKIAKIHGCDNEMSRKELRTTIIANWHVNETFLHENKIIPLGMKVSTNFYRFLAKLSKEVSDRRLALELLWATMESRIQSHPAPQVSYITETDIKTTLEQLELRSSNNDTSRPATLSIARPTALSASKQLKPVTPKFASRPTTKPSGMPRESRSYPQTTAPWANPVTGEKRSFENDDDIYGASPPRVKRHACQDKVGELVERNRVRHGGLGEGERS